MTRRDADESNEQAYAELVEFIPVAATTGRSSKNTNLPASVLGRFSIRRSRGALR